MLAHAPLLDMMTASGATWWSTTFIHRRYQTITNASHTIDSKSREIPLMQCTMHLPEMTIDTPLAWCNLLYLWCFVYCLLKCSHLLYDTELKTRIHSITMKVLGAKAIDAREELNTAKLELLALSSTAASSLHHSTGSLREGKPADSGIWPELTLMLSIARSIFYMDKDWLRRRRALNQQAYLVTGFVV